MFNESRIDIYDYLYNLFFDVVTQNVYSMREPQELTASDTTDGFIVITVGNVNDVSEFTQEAYGWVRCFVEAYIPPITRGRLDYDKYALFENSINNVIHDAAQDDSGAYQIQEDSLLSMDSDETSNANNSYFTFIKSFIVNIH